MKVQDHPITPQLVVQHNLTEEEYKKIVEMLGRVPNLLREHRELHAIL
jgi:hypothetical protein